MPRHETIAGIDVVHPRTLFVPRLAHVAWGPLYAASIAPALRAYRGKVDVVLGSWAYPDGFAAVIAGKLLGVPSVVKLHGSDINVIAKLPGPRRLSRWALPQAAKIVAVSRALADDVVELGVPRENVAIVMNGVDAELFKPRDRAAARAELGLPPGPLALYVGNLKPEKGVHDLLAAWAKVATGTLAVVGGGPIAVTGERVIAVGPLPHAQVTTWMAAADVLVLASHAEGTPNVVLEALASGRRVVATAVGGIPDLVTSPELGELVTPRDPDALAAALERALATPYDPAVVARLGARGGWAASAAKLHEVLAGTVGARTGAR